ncbi:hypothetical protein AB0K80_23785 [Streptomyces sp. NPDC052682]|uniref:hypothetical protein n=1 Tax=Streptomyces sp. NPDC052682 TaxID=3154954 RepID=UPI003424FA90
MPWREGPARRDADVLRDRRFVVLVAVLDDPAGEGHLATVRHRHGAAPPGTVAEAGRALADHLRVPFHFPSLDVPDDEAPRRQRSGGCRKRQDAPRGDQ